MCYFQWGLSTDGIACYHQTDGAYVLQIYAEGLEDFPKQICRMCLKEKEK